MSLGSPCLVPSVTPQMLLRSAGEMLMLNRDADVANVDAGA